MSEPEGKRKRYCQPGDRVQKPRAWLRHYAPLALRPNGPQFLSPGQQPEKNVPWEFVRPKGGNGSCARYGAPFKTARNNFMAGDSTRLFL